MVWRWGPGLCALGLLVLAAGPAPAGASTSWRAGAARVQTSPPPFDAAADAAAFPSCLRSAFSGPRRFALQEPYNDVNGSGEFNYETDLYCDANANGRWDGIFVSGGVNHLARVVHDPIDARAIALSDGDRTVVIVSVVAQGLHENHVARMRERALQVAGPGLTDVLVSANHNESSPDTVGIYGAPEDPTGTVGLHSGIDDYYVSFLVERVAEAAKRAYDRLEQADLRVRTFPLPNHVRVRLSHNFPTTDDDRDPAAIDPKVRVLQARDRRGHAIATMMNLAAHNQEIGHSGPLAHEISSDWPGYLHDRLEQDLGGTAMFLVGDNGSEEDPETVPPVSTDEHPECDDGCYAQAKATGHALAEAVEHQVRSARPIRAGSLAFERRTFNVPVENNLFKAAFAGGLFGDRPVFPGAGGTEIRTHASVLDVGRDLQFIANPGEAFPALMLGSPWGIEDASCPDRPNPAVPTWHARARHRFQVGLADDLIGYEIPAWAFSSTPGVFTNVDGNTDACANDTDDRDARGHQHKLETEGVGPTASNRVATELTDLLDQRPDRHARIRLGRFIRADGSLSRSPEEAVGIWVAPAGAGTLRKGQGTVVGLRGIGSFGDVPVRRSGRFMDYDGARQAHGPDVSTRGMVVAERGCVRRYYLDVYPDVDAPGLGPSRRGDALDTRRC